MKIWNFFNIFNWLQNSCRTSVPTAPAPFIYGLEKATQKTNLTLVILCLLFYSLSVTAFRIHLQVIENGSLGAWSTLKARVGSAPRGAYIARQRLMFLCLLTTVIVE
ncbi:hypothetical protein D3C84_627820 [compost metagenome]